MTAEEILVIRKRRMSEFSRSKGDQPFRHADAREADLSGISWNDEDFSGCDLRSANLSGCKFSHTDFRDTDLWNADFSDSDLTGARNLLPAQLAATNLKRAILPESLSAFEALDSAKDLSQNCSKVFITLILAVVYTFLTIAMTKDSQLITDTGTAKLPVISTEIPIGYFYIVTPVLLLALFVYFHIYLQRLWEALAGLPAIFPDGRRLDEKTPAWLMNDLVRKYFPKLRNPVLPLSRLQYRLSILLGYVLIPFVLIAIWSECLRIESWRFTATHIFTITVVTAIGTYCYTLLRRTLNQSKYGLRIRQARWRRLLPAALIGFATATVFSILSFLALEVARVRGDSSLDFVYLLGIHPFLDVSNMDISSKPTSWTDLELKRDTEFPLVKGAKLSQVRLKRIGADWTFLAKASFEGVELSYGSFLSTDLRQTQLEYCSARAAFFSCRFADSVENGDLTSIVASLDKLTAETLADTSLSLLEQEVRKQKLEKSHSSRWSDSGFEQATFINANLCLIWATECRFSEAEIVVSHCDGAQFESCEFNNASFLHSSCRYIRFQPSPVAERKTSNMSRIKFDGTNCSDAKFVQCNLRLASFFDSVCGRALFDKCDVSGANFSDCSLREADLSTTTGLRSDQLLQAKTIYHAKLPVDLQKELSASLELPTLRVR